MPVQEGRHRDLGEASKWGNLLDVSLAILAGTSALWAIQNWY